MIPRLFPAVTAAALAFTLAACADEPRKRGSSSGETDPGPPGPTGAVNMEVYATETQDCPPGNVHIDIGAVNAAPPVVHEDGEDGAAVACSVVAEGSKFNASGSLKRGMIAFGFSDLVTNGSSAIGSVEFTDPATGVRYAATDGMPCVFQFAPGTAQGVEAGKIFVQFDCSNLVSDADATKACSSRYGYVTLEHCEGEPAM
jgi:hypothetical protein